MENHAWERCEPGGKARLAFECPVAQGVKSVLPLLVARGAKPGPTLLVLAGQHGRELHGAAGIARVFEELDVGGLSGTLVCLPLLNPSAARMCSQDYPNELARYRTAATGNWNMNRTWGLGHDSHAGVVSTAVAGEFVDRVDAVVDLHGWNSVTTAWGPCGNREMILSFGRRPASERHSVSKFPRGACPWKRRDCRQQHNTG